VHASLAAQASLRSNLPALLSQLEIPATLKLKNFLLMQPPDDLGLLVVDDPLLVQAAAADMTIQFFFILMIFMIPMLKNTD
jgi:hypothetical protein